MQLSRSLITAVILSFTLSAGFAASVPARAAGSTKQLGNPGSDSVDPARDVGSAGIHGAAMSLAGVRRHGIKKVGDAGSAASGAIAGVDSGLSQGPGTLGAGVVDVVGQGAAAAGCKDSNESVSCVLSDCLCTVLTSIIHISLLNSHPLMLNYIPRTQHACPKDAQPSPAPRDYKRESRTACSLHDRSG